MYLAKILFFTFAATKHISLNMEFKIGTDVVFMDSNLRGKVVKILPCIEVELEDGFVIQAHRNELLAVDPSDVQKLQGSSCKGNVIGIKEGAKASHKKSLPSKHLSVDLHIDAIPFGNKVPKGGQLSFQIEYFHKILRSNLKHRGVRISFVHGVGDGILRDAIRKELDDRYSLRCSYLPADPGVTVVTIK